MLLFSVLCIQFNLGAERKFACKFRGIFETLSTLGAQRKFSCKSRGILDRFAFIFPEVLLKPLDCSK